MSGEATPQHPIYTKQKQDYPLTTTLFMVICNKGWSSSIVCTGMYEWAADWLVAMLDGIPFAKGYRP